MPRPYRRRNQATVAATLAGETVIPFVDRSFGLELELLGLDIADVARVLMDAGIDCRAESYNHQTRTWWKAVTDVSIEDAQGRNFHRGAKTAELVSPILSGEAGLETVRKVCRALSAAGAKVNKTTGLHVHIDGRALTGRTFAVIAKRYAMHEAIIDSFMPASRRGQANRFCHSLINNVNANNSALLRAASARDVLSVFGHRMFKVNYESYLRHGTVEFRHHSGSVNAEKVTNWIRFCQNFVSTSSNIANATVAAPRARRAPSAPRRAPNAEMRLAKFFAENSGRHQQSALAAAIGISEASVPAVISKLRRLVPHSRITKSRWWGYECRTPLLMESFVNGTVAAPSVAAPALDFNIPANDSPFAGLSPDVAGYYQERISDLAGA